MSGPSKSNAQKDQVMGTVKENTLGLFSDKQKAEGQVQHASGESEQKAAEAKGWVEGAYDNVVGGAKKVIGQVTGDNSQEAEGRAQDLKGDAKRAVN